MSELVLAVQPHCDHLVDSRTWDAVWSPFFTVYESASGGSPQSSLQLKDAVRSVDGVGGGDSLLIQPGSDLPGAAAQRRLHFRVFDPVRAPGETTFQLLGAATVTYADLLAASNKKPIQIPLIDTVSPLGSQTLRAFKTTLTLTVRPASASASEAASERVFEKALLLLHGETFEGLPKEVEQSELAHKQSVQLHISATSLPALTSADGTVESANGVVLLAALFEKDLRSGNMKLQTVTPWTRAASDSPAVPIRFPGTLTVDYYPGEQQEFQLSLYRFRLASPTASTVPPSLFGGMKEEDRVGSVEFLLDYLGLETPFLVSRRREAAKSGLNITTGEEIPDVPQMPEGAGRLYTEARHHPNVIHMELALTHDVNARLNDQLRESNAVVTVSVDTSKHSAQRNSNVIVVQQSTEAAAPTSNGVSSSPSPSSATSAGVLSGAVPDAPEVDVAGQDQDSPELLARLIQMMEQGQTFIHYRLGHPARKQKLFYRNPHPKEDNTPGFLYLCDVHQNPSDMDVSGLTTPSETPQSYESPDGRRWQVSAVFDACSITDIYLGKQYADAEDDDTLSFSLVTASSASLNVEALTAKQRAAWILGIMGILKNPDDEQYEDQPTGSPAE